MMSTDNTAVGIALRDEQAQIWLEGWLRVNKDASIHKAKDDALEEAQMYCWKYQSALKAAYELEFVYPAFIPKGERI